jgi:hypothetical protein
MITWPILGYLIALRIVSGASIYDMGLTIFEKSKTQIRIVQHLQWLKLEVPSKNHNPFSPSTNLVNTLIKTHSENEDILNFLPPSIL